MTNNNTIHELKQRKAKLEQNIRHFINEELSSFLTDTGMSPDNISLESLAIETISSEKSKLIVTSVNCPMEI